VGAPEVPEKLRDRVAPRRSLPAFIDAPTEKSATRELATIAKIYAKQKRFGSDYSPKSVFAAGLEVSKEPGLRKLRREAHALLSAPTLDVIKTASIDALAVAERMAHYAASDTALVVPIGFARGAPDAVRVMVGSLGLTLEAQGFTRCVYVVSSDAPSRWSADWQPLRHVVCAASKEDYARAVKVAAALRKKLPLNKRARIAYAFPDEPWAEDDLRAAMKHTPEDWVASDLLSATTSLDLVREFLALPDRDEAIVDHGMNLAMVFPEKDVLELLGAELAKLLAGKYALKSRPRALVDAVALYKTKRAAAILAPYLGNAIVGPLVASYFQNAPELRGVLGEIAKGKSKSSAAAQHVLARVVDKKRGPVAKDSEVPAVLRERPWLPRPDAVKPVVKRLVIPKEVDERVELTEAERAGRFEPDAVVRDMTPEELTKWRAKINKREGDGGFGCVDWETSYPKSGGMEYHRVPDDEGLAAWNAGRGYIDNRHVAFLARHGVAAIPGFLAREWIKWLSHMEVGDESMVDVLAHIVSPRIAPTMARVVARRKNFRKGAFAWMVRYPETAALGLIPDALSQPGEARDDAELSLRMMEQKGARALIMRAAARYASEVEIAALLARDPLAIDKKPPKVPDFLRRADLPPVRSKSGARLPDGAVDALVEMLRVAALDPPYPGVALVREACDEVSLGAISLELVEQWVLAGHPGRFEWMLFSAVHLPSQDTTARVSQLARDWARRDRKGALRACTALAAIGTDISLLHLGHIASTSRFADLRDAARAMLDEAAAARGLGRDELEDRIVPDLPLDERGFDGLKGDDRKAAERQFRRFEEAMVRGRAWPPADFVQRIVQHGMLVHLARRLVWEQGGTFFRVTEDGSFADASDKTVSIGDAPVRIAHPARVSDAERRAWTTLFAEYRVVQPFEQLARLVTRPTDSERAQKRVARSIKVAATKALGTLESRGWRRDDRGHVGAYLHDLRTGGEARMSLDPGISMADIRDEPPVQTIEGVDLPVTCNELDPVDFSEIVRDLDALGV
jgi:hypothetical protein